MNSARHKQIPITSNKRDVSFNKETAFFSFLRISLQQNSEMKLLYDGNNCLGCGPTCRFVLRQSLQEDPVLILEL